MIVIVWSSTYHLLGIGVVEPYWGSAFICWPRQLSPSQYAQSFWLMLYTHYLRFLLWGRMMLLRYFGALCLVKWKHVASVLAGLGWSLYLPKYFFGFVKSLHNTSSVVSTIIYYVATVESSAFPNFGDWIIDILAI